MSNMFWLVLELAVNLIQGIFCAYFVCGSLRIKRLANIKIIPFAVCTLLMFAVITVTSYYAYFEGIVTFLHAVTLFVFSLIFLEGTVFNKIFISLVPINAVSVGSIFASNVISYIVKKPIYEFLSESTTLRLLTVLFGNLIFFLILFVIKRITSKSTLRLKESEWLLLSFDLAISIIAYITMNYSIYSSNSLLSNFFTALCGAAIIIINITMYIVLSKFSNRYKIQMENTLLRQQVEYHADVILETKKQYDELQKVRHDFNNTVNVIRTLNTEGKGSEIEEYIQEYLKSQTVSKTMIKTGNSFVDAVINSKLSEAQQDGIKVSISAISDLKSEHNIDLCSLIGNLLDNAVRASKESSQKVIKLDIRREGESVVIAVKNTIDSSVLSKNPDLVSDKQDKKNHGYGTKIIREIAKKHSGFADFYEEDGYFCCNVMLYLGD